MGHGGGHGGDRPDDAADHEDRCGNANGQTDAAQDKQQPQPGFLIDLGGVQGFLGKRLDVGDHGEEGLIERLFLGLDALDGFFQSDRDPDLDLIEHFLGVLLEAGMGGFDAL